MYNIAVRYYIVRENDRVTFPKVSITAVTLYRLLYIYTMLPERDITLNWRMVLQTYIEVSAVLQEGLCDNVNFFRFDD